MQPVKLAKTALKEKFPALWLEWHFLRRPRSAEIELRYLRKLIPDDAVTVDVGANCGLYTRELARYSRHVHAFEPAWRMANLLRRTSAANVEVHELAASDRDGIAVLSSPLSGDEAVHSLASIEQRHGSDASVKEMVQTARLDCVVKDDVALIKIDVEGHELRALIGAVGLIERCSPIFLVEAEERHAPRATASLFEFFAERGYHGYFIMNGAVWPVREFDVATMQDTGALLPDGGRKPGRCYINNFFFFPPGSDGSAALGA
jgi:FkbM family methyltransferase